ncbi:VOC family protein [Nocardia arthritidis]|uniref:Glyoxalase n=1 Tax=Nocardia arthritidis TaxID=228602 RepID=A0A6G9YQL7_9NOCA|nr:VOC family protein [Nocardia arthritidis]QIS15471.1 glyoxalase [Nocardia arthritidis]
MTNQTTTPRTAVWPCLAFRDAHAMVEYLVKAFGFEQAGLYTREGDPSIVEHGELRWPLGGGIMFASTDRAGTPFCRTEAGTDNVYIVCDDPDALFERATAVGVEIVRGLRDEDYGSRGFSVRDPEGNLWSFGTYAGE